MKRKHKSYSKPKRPFDKVRIDEESNIRKEFGLKNKKEIWKAESRIKKMREKAKKLVSASDDEKKKLFDQIGKMGLKVESLADVLSLETRDYLSRRLQTVLVNKKLANTPKMARQFIVHKKVLVDGKAVSSPSYIVSVDVEDKISLKAPKKKQKKTEEKAEKPKEEKSEEVKEGESE